MDILQEKIINTLHTLQPINYYKYFTTITTTTKQPQQVKHKSIKLYGAEWINK